MGLLTGATPLVELILKKYGDDVAGATQELVRMGGFPEPVARRIATGELPMDEASRQARKSDFNGEEFYKGMYPYDWTKEAGDYKGPVISEINRTTPFPSFGGSDGDVDIAGFMSQDPEIASRFANPNLMRNGAVFPLLKKSNSEHVIDAAGANAGDIQFGEAGKPFRDAIRSGEYDSVRIKNTADEGDVHVALDPTMIRSPNAAFDPQYTGSNIMGGATVPMLSTTAGLSGAGLLASQIKDSGMISAPRSENLFNLTMGARDLERRLEGSPGSWLFPSGLIEYLETVNRREEDPNAMTRGMALLDVLPW